MDSREFTEWMEYYKLEPFGDDWLQAATIAATTVGVWSKRPIRLSQFIPTASRKQSPEEIEAIMTQWALQHNARVAKKQEEERQKQQSLGRRHQKRRTTTPPIRHNVNGHNRKS